jgi:predicted DNA-binding protein
MPTTKKRTNITLSDELDGTLDFLSKRDSVSKSTKVVQLIQIAIELDEDEVWNSLAEARDKKDAKFISHKNTWK